MHVANRMQLATVMGMFTEENPLLALPRSRTSEVQNRIAYAPFMRMYSRSVCIRRID